MRAFLTAIAVMVVVTVAANFALTALDYSSAEVFSTNAVRLSD